MGRETKAEMQKRLEQEISNLKKKLEESYEREQQLIAENISLKDNIEEQFKQAPLYIQMEREITNLKASSNLDKEYIKNLEEIREKQRIRIEGLENKIEEQSIETKNIKNKKIGRAHV